MGKDILNDSYSLDNNESFDFISRCNKILESLVNKFKGDEKSIKSAFPGYQGSYDTELEFAIAYFDDEYLDWLHSIEAVDIPQHVVDVIVDYIDYESFRKDIFEKKFFSLEIDGQTHVFKRG